MFTFILLSWFLGFFFFWKIPFPRKREHLTLDPSKVSIIIPARNEEGNLKRLLASLRDPSLTSCEIIVVDDHSEDATAQVCREAGVAVISSAPLPGGWVGKTWACWQGANQARGDLLIFLDADTFLEPEGLSKILSTYGEEEGVLSIQPFHKMTRAYERLSAYFNIISMAGVNAFTPLGSRVKPSGAFGQCFICKKKDYFDLGGHQTVRGEILEHLALGKEFLRANRKVRCYGGKDALSVRMYPYGLGSLIKGFMRSFATGSHAISLVNLLMVVCWITAQASLTRHLVQAVLSGSGTDIVRWVSLDLFFIFQMYWMLYRIGNFGFLTSLFFQIPLLFFVLIFFSSFFLTFILRKTRWKGRMVKTGGTAVNS
jgi:4,4'-diaponeurosporenoate glycosyltransferase